MVDDVILTLMIIMLQSIIKTKCNYDINMYGWWIILTLIKITIRI